MFNKSNQSFLAILTKILMHYGLYGWLIGGKVFPLRGDFTLGRERKGRGN